jgi:cysteine-rich repeat protein
MRISGSGPARAFWAGGLAVGLCVFTHGLASAQPSLSKNDQKCVNEINKNVAKVVKTQAGDIKDCIKNGSKGKLGAQSIEECITSDPKGKVQKATGSLSAKVESKCAVPPVFPFIDTSDTADMNARAIQEDLSLIHWIFGTDLDAVIVPQEGETKAASKCQNALVKDVLKCQDTKLKAYNACKKNKLKGKGTSAATSAHELELACLHDAATGGIPDGKGKLAGVCVTKLDDDIGKKCGGQDLDTLFPGCEAEDLQTCLDQKIECEVCLLLDQVDGLRRNCDEFDDGLLNGSCRCGDGIVDLGETCDDGNRQDGDGCSALCVLEGPIGTRTCVFDAGSFCVGGERDGDPCTDTLLHSDCPPGAPVARCIGNTGIQMDTFEKRPEFTVAMVGSIELDCGAIDPNTRKAVCRCDVAQIEPIDLGVIGYVCMSSIGDCPAGEMDCAGGAALDMDLVNEHDAGPVVQLLDPNALDVGLYCGFLDPNATNPNANEQCAAACDLYCPSLGDDFATFRAGCEGFCRGGSRDGEPCDFDGECVDADCLGADPITHRSVCGCHCLELGGGPSRPGALTCELGLSVVVETEAPCDETDVTVKIPGQCVPMTTEDFTQTILTVDAEVGDEIGPDEIRGQPVECSELIAGKLGGLTMVGNSTSYDTLLGDLSVPIRMVCVDEQ